MAEIIDVDEYKETEGLPEYLYDLPPNYRDFQEQEGIPVHQDIYFDNLTSLETGHWDRTGQQGAFINLLGAHGTSDLHLHTIEPEGETKLQNYMFEQSVYVLEGTGITTIGKDEDFTFEWTEGSVFFIPPGVSFKHINTGSGTPTLIKQTTLPVMMASLSYDLIFDLPLEKDLAENYYSSEGKVYKHPKKAGYEWDAAFIPDVQAFDKLQDRPDFGAHRSCSIFPDKNTGGHIADSLSQQYKVAHRHQPGSTLFIITGEGYELIWRDKWDVKLKIPWGPGTIYSPPGRWRHHRFNITAEPSRHLAFHGPNFGTCANAGNPIFYNAHPDNRIEYVDEDPVVREHYEAELNKRGLELLMPDECYTNPDYEFSFD